MEHYFRVNKIKPRKPSIAGSVLSLLFSNFSVVNWLIVANVVFFILTLFLGLFSSASVTGNYEQSIFRFLALQPNHLFNDGYVWTLITSMFMHAGFIHLFVNMLSLLFIGKFLEMILGKKRFFWMYIFAGIFAGLFFAVFSFYFGTSIVGRGIFSDPHIYAVGASGAIFAIAGVLAVLIPKKKVSLLMGPLVAIILQSVLWIFITNQGVLSFINLIVNIYIFLAIFSMLSFSYKLRNVSLPVTMPFWVIPFVAIVPLIIIGLFVELPIGNMAHLGGFIFGALYGFYLRFRYKKKTKMLSQYFS